MPLAKPMRGLQALRNEGLATLKQPIIPGFPSPSCGRGFSHGDAFGKTRSWVASPEERRDGDPETPDNPRVSIAFPQVGNFILRGIHSGIRDGETKIQEIYSNYFLKSFCFSFKMLSIKNEKLSATIWSDVFDS